MIQPQEPFAIPQDTLTVALAQHDIVWEDKTANLATMRQSCAEAAQKGADLIVFPEMMTTGFSIETPQIAEPLAASPTLQTLQEMAYQYDISLITSFPIQHEGLYYHRAFCLTPQGDSYTQDKRHLFRLAQENRYLQPAQQRNIFSIKGWRILLTICYDLRFPVWCRNVNQEYDLLINIANWPERRQFAWDLLLRARAVENIAYVCGVNRVGTDPQGFRYQGGSLLLSPEGKEMVEAQPHSHEVVIGQIQKFALEKTRSRYPFSLDADRFTLSL